MTRVFCAFTLLLLISLAACRQDNPTEGGSLPAITGFSPNLVAAGDQNVQGKITGANFVGIVVVDLGPGVQIKKTVLSSPTQILVKFNVSSTAEPGPRAIRVITSGGTASNSTALSVQDNRPPIAQFTVSPASGAKNVVFTLDASPSSDPDGTVVSYDWQFGDGTTGSGKVLQHQYGSAGTFSVTLTVRDNSQGTASISHSIVVENEVPPSANFNHSPQEGNTTTLFRFDGSSSKDGDGRIVKYLWDFGDGAQEGKRVQHIFESPDRFKVKLTVVDNDGLEGFVEKEVRVRGIPPVAAFTVNPESGDINTTFRFDASASQDIDGRIVRYQWNFSDGTRKTGQTLDHKFTREGDFKVILVVIDNDDKRHSIERSVHVEKTGGGGDDPQQCTNPSGKHEPFFFKVLSEDQSTKTIIGKFVDNVSCDDVFYLCGDVRIGGIEPGSKEYWIGIICEMYDLGDRTFRIHLVEGKHWVDAGESGTYVWPQDDCDPAIYCR